MSTTTTPRLRPALVLVAGAALLVATGCAGTLPTHAAPAAQPAGADAPRARAAVPAPLVAHDESGAAPRDAAADDAWTFSAAPYFWLFAADGDATVHGRTVPVSTNLSDTWDLVKDHIEPSFAGHFEASRGDVSILADANYVHLAGDRDFAFTGPFGRRSFSGRLDVDVQLTFAELGAAVRAAQFAGAGGRTGTVDVLGGARWNSLDVDTDFRVSGRRITIDRDLDGRSDWFDPFVGLRTAVPLGECLDLRLRSDVGGGVGDGSDLAWNVVTGLQWRVSDQVDVFAGYRWYDIDRDAGGRETDLQIAGPGIGAVIRF